MSEATDKADALTACPACGHAARFHWPRKGGYYDMATSREQKLTMRMRDDAQPGIERQWTHASNSTPGNLPSRGCFKATEELWTEPRDGKIYNYYHFCDCPMDNATVLALVAQGKTFAGTIS